MIRLVILVLNLERPFSRDCRTIPASGTTVGGLPPGRAKMLCCEQLRAGRIKVNRVTWRGSHEDSVSSTSSRSERKDQRRSGDV